jgi:hypothetical protein
VTVHVRVVVPTTTMANRPLLRLLNDLYGPQLLNSREDRGATTTAWLRFDDFPTPGPAVDGVRAALADHGIVDGVQVDTYRPRSDATARRRRTGTGSPWRTSKSRRLLEQRRAQEGGTGP